MTRLRLTRSIRLLLIFGLLVTAFAALVGTTSAHGWDGQVYTITNEAGGNRVAIFNRAPNGDLSPAGFVNSGGNGTGTGLGTQGAVVLSNSGRWLFVVNAGSNSISSFRVTPWGLELADTEASGGNLPVSLTVHDNLLYVLNAGTSPNITGFSVGFRGNLSMIAGSTEPVSSTTAVQVQFSPDGRVLVVAGKTTNMFDTYLVDRHGVAGSPQMFPANAATPFGFAFDNRGHMIVSEASGFVTPYSVSRNGSISPITDAVPTNQSAACWLVITQNGRYTYTANAGSHSITGFAIAHNGALTILNADGVTADTGAGTHPVDLALSNNSHFLYVNNGIGGIGGFRVHFDGSLSSVTSVTGLPASTTGLASN
jgi:6-phosphogluconolactonase